MYDFVLAPTVAPVPSNSPAPDLFAAYPLPPGSFWYRVLRGSLYAFGIGISVAGRIAVSVLFVTNFLPQPVGFVPASWFGLQERWAGLTFEDLIHLIETGEVNPALIEAANAAQVADNRRAGRVTVEVFSHAGLLLTTFEGWLVDP